MSIRTRAGSHGVPSHLRSIPAVLAIESMEVGTYHFAHGPKYDMDAHMTTLFGDGGEGLVFKVGPNKKLHLTLNTSHVNIFSMY